MKPKILTGIRPTGALHIGHYLGMLEQTAATMRVLLDGTQRARRVARSTMARVKRAMKLDYELEAF